MFLFFFNKRGRTAADFEIKRGGSRGKAKILKVNEMGEKSVDETGVKRVKMKVSVLG